MDKKCEELKQPNVINDVFSTKKATKKSKKAVDEKKPSTAKKSASKNGK